MRIFSGFNIVNNTKPASAYYSGREKNDDYMSSWIRPDVEFFKSTKSTEQAVKPRIE